MKSLPKYWASRHSRKQLEIMDLLSLLSCKRQINSLSLHRIGLRPLTRGERLKGNQVQVLNSPAAVSSYIMLWATTSSHWKAKSGKALAIRTSQKTYHANSFHCFRGKSVESNDPDISSIISFTTLIQRKCVQTNKLCQVYYVCPVEAISPGHFYE